MFLCMRSSSIRLSKSLTFTTCHSIQNVFCLGPQIVVYFVSEIVAGQVFLNKEIEQNFLLVEEIRMLSE